MNKVFNLSSIFPKDSDRYAYANSDDPDWMPQNITFDQGLHCLPLILRVLNTVACM